MSAAKQKGTAAETAVVDYLDMAGFNKVERRTLSGPKDRGDINLGSPHLNVVIEVKNCRTPALSEWMKETNQEILNAGADYGAVWHKRIGKGSPGEWYVTMDGKMFTKILKDLEEYEMIGQYP